MKINPTTKGPFQVVYEDNHLVIVNKDAGVLVQGDNTGDKPLVEYVRDYIGEKFNKPGNVFCGLVHRIDRPVSGLVTFARTSKGLERMNKLLREKKLYKTYWAIVKKHPPEKKGKLTHWLLKDEKRNVTTVYDKPTGKALRSELYYSVLGKLNDHFLVEVKPITGRPHQIRAQLGHVGSPIRGDLRYGFKKPNEDKSINLHARRLDFEHPIKKESVLAIAGVPNDEFWEQFLTLDNLKEKNIDKLINDEGIE